LYFLDADWYQRTAALSDFKNVKKIYGPLHFAETKGLGNVKCFENLEEIRSEGAAFILLNNVGLQSLKLTSLRLVENPKPAKTVLLHANADFDTSGFIDKMKALNVLDEDIINTTNAGRIFGCCR
ncbi:receptor L domain protein, partial [Ostertagia ostertagi]